MSAPDNKATPSSNYTYPPPSVQRDITVDHTTKTHSDLKKDDVNPPSDEEDQGRKNFERLKKDFPVFFGGMLSGSFTGGTVQHIDGNARSTFRHYPEAPVTAAEVRKRFNADAGHVSEGTGNQTVLNSTSARPPPDYRGPGDRNVAPPFIPEGPIHVQLQPRPGSGARSSDNAGAFSSFGSTSRTTTVIVNGGENGNNARCPWTNPEEFFSNTESWTVINGGEFTSYDNGRYVAKVEPGDIVRRDRI